MWTRLHAHSIALLASLLLVMTLGCSVIEGTPPPNEEMVGNWIAVDQSADLQISADGHVNYHRQRGGSTTEINLPAKAWTDTTFTVGALGLTTDFTIDVAPEQVDGVWHMTVDGLEYVRL